MTGQTDHQVINRSYVHLSVKLPLPGNPVGPLPIRSLFLETLSPEASAERPLYTLRIYDYSIPESHFSYRPDGPNLLRSLYQVYLECSDPSEFDFAMVALGSWEHWASLKSSTFFQPHYKKMRAALKAKIESETFKIARHLILNDKGSQSLQALKWLNDQVKDKTKGRGRPSNEEVEGELKRQVALDKELTEDAARLGIN